MQLVRSFLFVPAIRERMIAGAAATDADALVLDLEDSVAAKDKQAARKIAARAIGPLAAAAHTVFVRVNGLRSGLTRADLLAVAVQGLAGVVLPKTESPQDLRDLDVLLREGEMKNGVRPGDIVTMPLIESARGVLRCEEIARASDRVAALSVGGEDYTADLGVARDPAALQHLRATVVQVAAAYGLLPIDTPYPDHADAKGLAAEARLARAIGLKGKYAIHPGQIWAINRVFSPSAEQVAEAKRIVAAFRRAKSGAISVGGRMVDAPIAARAQGIVALDAALRGRKRGA